MERCFAVRAAVVLLCCVLVGVVSAATPEQLEKRAFDAMAAGRYSNAAGLWQEVLEQTPGHFRALYNLACCFSQTGDLDQAASRLEQAYDAGMRDTKLLLSDPDLENLRDSDVGRALIDRLTAEAEQLRRFRGVPGTFEAPVLGKFRVVVPPKMKKDRTYPLVMILHGHGANPENYVGMFERVASSLEAIVCAPYGPYPIPFERGHGYSWYPAPWFFQELLAADGSTGDRAQRRQEMELRETQVSRAFVLAAIDNVSREFPVDPDRVFLIGHSEGGVLAYGLALKYPDRFRGLIVVGARLRASDATPEILAGASEKLEVMICHSRGDNAVSYDQAKAAAEILKSSDVQSKIFPYDGGHGFTAELAQTIGRWIAARSRD